jgi:FkbM family methyltransferase
MFHYPACSVCDSWTPQDDFFELMSEKWENTLSLLKVADPDQHKVISRLGSKTLQQGAVREFMERLSASPVQIKCEFDTLSRVIARENIQSIGLLKLDAELADWEILRGLKAQDWPRIRQVAMEVHVESDVVPISNFLNARGFGQVVRKKLGLGTNCLWARR